MDDAFRSPRSDEALDRRGPALIAAGCLYVVAIFLAVVLGLAVLTDIARIGWSLAAGDAGVVSLLVGALCRDSVLAVLAAGAWAGAQALRDPGRHGAPAIAAAELRQIYRRHHLDSRDDLPDPGPYADRPDHALVEVVHGIDRDRAPERWARVLAAVKVRVEARRQG